MSQYLMGMRPTPPVIRPEAVYLFATCLVDLFVPEAGLSTVRLLAREGIRVIFPEDQTCCGQPAYSSGQPTQAQAVARRQLDLFPEPWPIVVPSGSCAGMIRQHYPEIFADDPETLIKVRDVASRTWELSEFLVHVLKFDRPDTGSPCHIALHTSCSARRETTALDTTRQLLANLKNVEVHVQERESECCGFGGMFSVKHPAISGAMVADKVAALTGSGAEHVVTADCGCLLNITGHAQKTNTLLTGEHLAHFLWQRTQASEESQ